MNSSSGKFILQQLERFGSDVEKRHEMTFWLYFPSQDNAQQAASLARSHGLRAEIVRSRADSENHRWLCLLQCPHVPDEALLDGISQFCGEITARFDGLFDGWETRLELADERSSKN
jgi:hypothetical protein